MQSYYTLNSVLHRLSLASDRHALPQDPGGQRVSYTLRGNRNLPNIHTMSKPKPASDPAAYSLPSLAAEHTETHFLQNGHRFPVTGMEIKIEGTLKLNDRYRHIMQAIHTALQGDRGVSIVYHTPRGPVVLYGQLPPAYAGQTAAGHITVYWYEELMLSFAADTEPSAGIDAHQALEYLMPYLAALRILRASNGMMIVDHAQLLRYQSYRWRVYSADHDVLYNSQELSYTEMMRDLSLITGRRSLRCSTTDGVTYNVTARSSEGRHVLCDGIPTRAQAREIARHLADVRKKPASPCFELNITTGIEEIPFPGQAFHQDLTVLFPSWVAPLNDPMYRQHIRSNVRSATPAASTTRVEFASMAELEALLPLYREWLEDIRLMNQLGVQHYIDNTAAFQLLKLILQRQVTKGKR